MCTDDFDIRQALTEAFELGLATARAGYRGDAVELIDAAGTNVVSMDRRRRARRSTDPQVVPAEGSGCPISQDGS